MLSDDATVNELCDTAEDFTWVFNYVKTNAEQLRTRFKNESYSTTGDYKTAFFVNGLRAIITTWIDNNCADSVEQMNEIIKILASRKNGSLFLFQNLDIPINSRSANIANARKL